MSEHTPLVGLDDVPEREGAADEVLGDDLFLRDEFEQDFEHVGVKEARRC